MKARPFLTALAGVLLSLVLVTSGLLWGINQRSPLRLADQPLDLPRAARFVPRDAALSLHWLLDPGRLPAYVRRLLQPRSVVRHGTRLNVGGMAFLRWRDWISRRNWPAGLALNSA